MHSIGLQFIKFGPTWCLGRLTFSAEDLIGLMALLFFQCIDHVLARKERELAKKKKWNCSQVEIDFLEVLL